MRRKALALSLLVILLASVVSGCIGGGGTKTITVTKTIGPEEDTSTPTSSASPSSMATETHTTTSEAMATETVTPPEDKNVIQADCSEDSWKNDYEQAIVCGVQEGFRDLVVPSDFGVHTNNKTKVPLEFAEFLGNKIYLDVKKENQSMIQGEYFGIQTPIELLMHRKGTYADFAIAGAYVFLYEGLDTYVIYIKTEKGIGLFPGFRFKEKYYDRIFVVYWPYLIPITLGGTVELLNIAGDPVQEIKLYHLWRDGGSVKAKLETSVEPGPLIPAYLTSASSDYFDNQGWVKLDMMEKLPEVLQQDNPQCKYVESTDDIYYRNLKEYEVNVPLMLYLYSKTYQDQWTDILAKAAYEYLKQQGFDVQKCRKFTLLDVSPSVFVKGGMYIRIYAEMPES
ncbi:hypothetical protein E3E38_08905 [Thermococcus sp. 18S1]|uniref:transglutaminase-like domain-containing protein n=1 Tax=Thermococcus sp. 18S1 TaxID=1638210 RepID=UPI00143AABB9|nr:transglutaminase-like domain-containing protein [Thermococcus sp. 18S1]NJE31160.1 hypothetical protein [Thermococcus sp. 18S1]